MSAEALEEVGVDPIMTRATVKRLEWVVRLATKAHFKGQVPEHYAEAIRAIELLACRQDGRPAASGPPDSDRPG